MHRHTKLPILLLALYLTSQTNATENNTTEQYNNLTGGNPLWNGIFRDCKAFPTTSCIQKNVFHYLDDTLDQPGDLNFGQFMKFKPNTVNYTKYTREANTKNEEEDEGRADTPLEEVTNALTKKSTKFLMTHDVEIKLPSMMEGATFKLSPRGFEGDGVLVRLDVIQQEAEARKDSGVQPRIFIKQITKYIFKKLFKNKLVSAFLSLFLVLTMLKVKLLFIAPILLGVGTAKKILLKVLLFLFPALAHLFKLCSYYHNNYHQTKFHHHHHKIIHHTVPGPHGAYGGHGGHGGHHVHQGLSHQPPEIYLEPQHESYPHEYPSYELSGPGLGPEYISNRKNYDQHKPGTGDANEIKSWGLGQGQKDTKRGQQPKLPQNIPTKSQIDSALHSQKDTHLRLRLQQEQLRVRQQNMRLQEQLKQELKIQEQLKIQAMALDQQKNKLQGGYQKQSQQQQKSNHDPFYSPILQRIDAILVGLGFQDEPCRERLICSMYKNPVKFSPHSNLLSAELSRDSKELVKPSTNNDAVVRFYKYVQAARDGQDQRECLRLYPSCAVNTE